MYSTKRQNQYNSYETATATESTNVVLFFNFEQRDSLTNEGSK